MSQNESEITRAEADLIVKKLSYSIEGQCLVITREKLRSGVQVQEWRE